MLTAAGSGLLIGTGSTANPIIFGTNDVERMRITSGGAVEHTHPNDGYLTTGFIAKRGTTGDAASMSAAGGAGVFMMRGSSAYKHIKFSQYNGTTQLYPMVIDNVQNVGINTTTPQGRLDVKGSIRGEADAYTKLLIHSDTTDGVTTFVDSSPSGHAITNTDVVHSTTKQAPGMGASSLKIVANEDRLFFANSSDWDFGSGDWTIDCWINPSSAGASGSWGGIVSFAPTPNSTAVLDNLRLFSSTRRLSLGISGQEITSDTAVTLGAWSHVAVVRSGAIITFYLNGVEDGVHTGYNGTNFVSEGVGIEIGSSWIGYSGYYWDGYLDEIRISKGIARWTSSFLPPTRPYATVNDEYFADQDEISTLGFGTPLLREGALDGVCYTLNGSSDYIKVTAALVPTLSSTHSFSMWVYEDSSITSANAYIWEARGTGGSSGKSYVYLRGIGGNF